MRFVTGLEVLNILRAEGVTMSTMDLVQSFADPEDFETQERYYNAQKTINKHCNILRKQGYLEHPKVNEWRAKE